MVQNIIKLIEQYLPTSIQLHFLILKHVKIKKYKKGEFYIQVGDICDGAFYLSSGLLRGYIEDSKKEKITCWFKWEGEFVTSVNSFCNDIPSAIGIEFIENSTVYILKKDILIKCNKIDPQAGEVYTRNLEKNFIRLEQLIISHITQNATERYLQLMEEYPLIVQRAPLSYIASYIGVTQSSLSRLRAKYQR